MFLLRPEPAFYPSPLISYVNRHEIVINTVSGVPLAATWWRATVIPVSDGDTKGGPRLCAGQR